MLRNIYRRFLQTIIILCDYLIPKNPRIIIFGSHSGQIVGGNSKVLFDYVVSCKKQVLSPFFFTRTAVNGEQYRNLERLTLGTLFLFLRAKTLVVTHGCGDFHWLRFSKRKYYIKLWHGRPGLKGEGYSTPHVTKKVLGRIKYEAKLTTGFLVCSRIESFMRSYSNLLHPRQIIPLGYPRNDVLLQPSKKTLSLHTLFSDLDFSSVILYAPTWRDYSKTIFFPWDDYDSEQLEEWLERNNALLLLRTHRNDNITLSQSKRIRAFGFDKCPEVTDILPEVDILVTDYSSITADFLLLDRPIVYVPYDVDEFTKHVGFCYNNIDFWMPGQKVNTFDEFLEALSRGFSGDDGFKEQRHIINDLVNEYQRPNSTELVYQYLIRLLGLK
ncbi:MAG: CDP-glycerol glycerophosphotransferase family protein [Candidatus Thorarchaeota archaeon]